MKKSVQWLTRKKEKQKIDYLQKKATQPEVLRAKERAKEK